MQKDNTLVLSFRVKVGHAEVLVSARTVEDAIVHARRLLVQDMPRFYDVIQQLDSRRFEVQRAA